MLVVAIVALAWVAFVEIPRRKWTITTRSDSSSDSQALFVSKGGAGWLWKVFYGRAGWPLVRIEVHEWGIRISGRNRALRWYVPTAELAWSSIGPIRRSGQSLVIRLATRPRGFLRITPYDQTVLAQIEARTASNH